MERKEKGTCTCRIERERGERIEDRGRKGLIEREGGEEKKRKEEVEEGERKGRRKVHVHVR